MTLTKHDSEPYSARILKFIVLTSHNSLNHLDSVDFTRTITNLEFLERVSIFFRRLTEQGYRIKLYCINYKTLNFVKELVEKIRTREVPSFDLDNVDFCFIAKKVFTKSLESKEYALWSFQSTITNYIKSKGASPIFLKNFEELFLTLNVGRNGVKYDRAINETINSLLYRDEEDLMIITDNILGVKRRNFLFSAVRNNQDRNVFLMNIYTGQLIIKRAKDGYKDTHS